MARNVYKEDVVLVSPPEQALWEDRGLSLCAKPLLVLADTLDSTYYKNDRYSKAYKVDSIDNVQLEAKDGTLYTAPYSLYNFPHQSDAAGFIIDWRQFITGGGVLRTGCFKLKITYTLAGTTNSFYEGAFDIKNYSIFNARNTVRLWVDLNDLVRKQGINYRGSGFTTMIRFEGVFGYMQPNYDSESITYVNDITEKVRNEAVRTYELRSSFLLRCATRQIDENILLTANRIRVTDHNALNHDQYYDFEVVVDEDKSPAITYPEGGSVYAKIQAFFKERQKLSESVYVGDIEGVGNVISLLPTGASACADATVDNSDATYSASVASGGTLVLPDSQLNVNSVDVGDVVSVKTIDVNVTDGDGDTLAPIISLVGNALGLVVPSEWAYFTIENSASANIRMTTNSGGNFIVDWGDGTVTSYASGNVDRLHTYASPYSGVVRVKAVNGLSDINQFRSTLGNWNFDIGLFNQLSGLTQAYFSGNSMTLTGDIASLSNLTFRAYFIGSSMTLTGDIASLSNLTFEAYFLGSSMTLTGDIASLSNLTYQAVFIGNSMTLTGDIASLSNLTYLAYFSGNSMTITGDISALSNLTYQAYFLGNSMTLTGDIASLSNLTFRAYFSGNSMTLTGDIASLSNLTFRAAFIGNSMTLSYTSTTWTAIPSNSIYLDLATGFLATSTEVDNLLIDLEATGASGSATIDLRYNNAPRTTASDAAVSALTSRGYTVLTN